MPTRIPVGFGRAAASSRRAIPEVTAWRAGGLPTSGPDRRPVTGLGLGPGSGNLNSIMVLT